MNVTTSNGYIEVILQTWSFFRVLNLNFDIKMP